MSKSMMLSLLHQGNTGDEILNILDSIATEDVEVVDGANAMVDVIEF